MPMPNYNKIDVGLKNLHEFRQKNSSFVKKKCSSDSLKIYCIIKSRNCQYFFLKKYLQNHSIGPLRNLNRTFRDYKFRMDFFR
jgi:hypothetical protein